MALERAIEHGEEQAKNRLYILVKQRTTKPEAPKVKARPMVPALVEPAAQSSKKPEGFGFFWGLGF